MINDCWYMSQRDMGAWPVTYSSHSAIQMHSGLGATKLHRYVALQVNLNDIRRCALFHYDPDKNAIEFRHYLISAQPVGISRAVKKIIHARIPDLSKVDDIADFVQRCVCRACRSSASMHETSH